MEDEDERRMRSRALKDYEYRRDRAANLAKERRITGRRRPNKAEKDNWRQQKYAKRSLIDSCAPKEVRDENGVIDQPKFKAFLRDWRDRVSVSLATQCRFLLPETLTENGVRHLLWLRAHGCDPKHPLPAGQLPHQTKFYKEMIIIDLARLKAIFETNPEKFTAEQKKDIRFYFYMFKNKETSAPQPHQYQVDYFVHRLKEKRRVMNYGAGMKTKGE
jgi:hypothetical protein